MTSDMTADGAPFAEDAVADRGSDEPTLIVDVGGFEGPLDLLLTLARQQKVDLAKISILALANQYLAFVEQARRTRLELAADYLVMAAWLAYLKSRMLLPEPVAPEGMSAADMAKALALRLKRLDAIREAGARLFERPLLGRDVFGRGDPQPIAEIKRPEWSATLYDLLSAYASERQRRALARVRFAKRTVWSLADARTLLERMIGATGDWSRLDEYLIAYTLEPEMRSTALASSLAATLELVREGAMEVHQSAAFAPIYLRKRVGERPARPVQARRPETKTRVQGWRRGHERRGALMAVFAELRVETFEEDNSEEPDMAIEARPEELRLLEALLFAAAEPLDEKTLGKRLPSDVDVHASLRRLQIEYAPRGVNLVHVGNRWAFRTANDLSWLLTKEAIEPKKLSRAAVETLAIIAYHQPVTRAEIEEIRGVSAAKGTVDVLLETGWIRPRGRRKAPGRPLTYGTTPEFLSHFGLEALGDLPGLDDLKGSGLFDGTLPPEFGIPEPSDDPSLRDNEEPLEQGDLDLGLAPRPDTTEE